MTREAGKEMAMFTAQNNISILSGGLSSNFIGCNGKRIALTHKHTERDQTPQGVKLILFSDANYAF